MQSRARVQKYGSTRHLQIKCGDLGEAKTFIKQVEMSK